MQNIIYLSLIPSILLGLYIYKNDKVEKEPTKLLIGCFLGGILSAISVIVLSFMGIVYEIDQSSQLSIFIYSFIGVALIEELCKFFILYFITYHNKEFNYLYDSIVYSSFLGLGFALFENIFYILSTNNIIVILIRGFITIPFHIFLGIFMGYYLGMAKKNEILNLKKIKKTYISLSLIIPIILHGFFDYCLFTNNNLSTILFVIFVFILYIAAFQKIKELSKIKKSLYE